jgi:hypothetical protein
MLAPFGDTLHDEGVLDSLAPARRRMVLTVLGLVSLAVVGVLAAVVVDRVGGGTPDQAAPGPVLVVPGYGGRVSSLDPLVAALRDQGRDVSVVQPVDGGTGDLADQVDRLDAAARAAMDDADAESVDVVGYSAGGVVARLWATGDGAGVARRVMSIGSPQHGTDVAQLALDVAGGCPTACEQLAPDSDLLRRLNAGDETPDGTGWITVLSTSDEVVTPPESAMLDGALNIVVQQFCPAADTSHTALPGDPVVLETLASTLGPADPRIPVDVRC